MKYFTKQGFSMVEALVAIAVLTIGVVTPLSMLASSLANADFARNQITAFFLAQEGQELIINYRDYKRLDQKTETDRLNQSYWLGGLGPCIDDHPGGTNNIDFCYIDTLEPRTIHRCDAAGKCPAMLLNEGFYGYKEGGTPTIFTRKIQIETVDTAQAGQIQRSALVRVTVEWRDRATKDPRSFNLNSVIYR